MKPAPHSPRARPLFRQAVASLLLATVALPMLAQTNPEVEAANAQVAIINAQTAVTTALTAQLKASAEFKTQQNAEAKALEDAQKAAAKEKEDEAKKKEDAELQEKKDRLTALSALGDKMPKGDYTVSSGTATPRSKELAYLNLRAASDNVYGRIADFLGNYPIVFATEMPTTSVSAESLRYKSLIDAIEDDADVLLKRSPVEITSVGAAAVITALPGILNAVSGLMRVDVTEQSFKGDLKDTEAVAMLAGTVISKRREAKTEVVDSPPQLRRIKKPAANGAGNAAQKTLVQQSGDGNKPVDEPAPGTQGGGASTADTTYRPGVYLSLDNYLLQGVDYTTVEISKMVEQLSKTDQQLAEALEKLEADTKAQSKAVANATAVAALAKAKVDDLEGRLKALDMLRVADPSQAQRWDMEIEKIGVKLDAARAAQTKPDADLAEKKAALEAATKDKPKLTDLRARIEQVFKDFRGTEGNPPLFARLLREDIMTYKKASHFRIVVLRVTGDQQSFITEKAFLSQTHRHASLVALQYTVSDGVSVIDTDVVPYFRQDPAEKAPVATRTSIPQVHR